MSTIKEYEYRPPNVRAIRWDGREDTAAEILRAAPTDAEFRVHIHKTGDSEAPNGYTQKIGLFFGSHQFAVNRGDYVVFEPDGRVHLAEQSEFEYTYREADINVVEPIGSMPRTAIPKAGDPIPCNHNDTTIFPTTLEDEDYDIDNQLRSTQ